MMTTSTEGKEFAKLLRDKEECSLFRSFVKKAACDENLMFWIEIELHKKEVQVFGGNFKVEYARKRNEEIWNKYFKVGGNYEINVDSDSVDGIRERLFQGTEEEANSFHLFDRAQEEVWLLMLNDSYSKFRKSNEYLLYVQKKEAQLARQMKKKKKSGSFHSSPAASLKDDAAVKKRNSIGALSKLFTKSRIVLPREDHEDGGLYGNERNVKIATGPNRRTFSGLNHMEITETSQSSVDSVKRRTRANSLEEIEIKEVDKTQISMVKIGDEGNRDTWGKITMDATRKVHESESSKKRVSVVRSRIRHSINSIRSFFSASSADRPPNTQRENLRSSTAPDLVNRGRAGTDLTNQSRSPSTPTLPQVSKRATPDLPRSPSDLIFDAFFLSELPNT